MEIFSIAVLVFLVTDPFGNIAIYLAALKNVAPERRMRVALRELLLDVPPPATECRNPPPGSHQQRPGDNAKSHLQQRAEPEERQAELAEFVGAAGIGGGDFLRLGPADDLDQGRRHRDACA